MKFTMHLQAIGLLLICFYFRTAIGYCLDFHNISECLIANNSTYKLLKDNTGWTGPVAKTPHAANYIHLNYTFILKAEKCCPVLMVITEPLQYDMIANGCLDIPLRLLDHMHLFGQILLIDWNNHHVITMRGKCNPPDSRGLYTCYGQLKVDLSEPRIASAHIFYPCETKQDIEMIINVSISAKNRTISCEELNSNHDCYKYYKSVHLPNLVGTSHYFRAELTYSAISPFVPMGCHQHIEEFLCRIILPECTSEGYVAPCKAMCEEILAFSTCKNIFKARMFDPVPREYYELFGILVCREFPTSNSCLIKNVTCNAPPKKMQLDVGNEPTLSLQCVIKLVHIYESVLLISP